MTSTVLLSRHHDRKSFDCGVPELNSFLKAVARQHSEKGISRTFVLVNNERPDAILGFFTLTLCDVQVENLPSQYASRYPKHGLPAVRLARLAVSQAHQGKGYGEFLLAEAVHRTLLIAEQAGSIGLFVDAKDERANSFYQHYGFVSLPGERLRLFLPLQTLQQLK